MSNLVLYGLALLGAGLGTVGDLCGTEAARGRSPALMAACSAIAWTCCCPVWIAMSSATRGGFARPAALWTVAGAVMSALVMTLYAESESPAKRALLVVVFVSAVARELLP